MIFIVSPLIVISFLSLTQGILFITKSRLSIAKDRIRKKLYLKNTLKVYVLALARTVTPKNWLTMKLGGFLKANQSNYFKVAQRLGLVYHLL